MKSLTCQQTKEMIRVILRLCLLFFFIFPVTGLAAPATKDSSPEIFPHEINDSQTKITQPTKISLDQAINDAQKKNLRLNNLRLEADGFSLEAQKIFKQKLFTINATGNYLYKSQTIFVELPPFSPTANAASPFRLEGGFKHNYDFGLAVTQPLFTGGRLSAQASFFRSAEAATSIKMTLLANEIATNLKLLFFEYRRLKARKNSLLAFKEQLSLHEKKIASLVEAELARRLNLVETKMKMEEVAASLLDIEQALAAIRFDFQQLCGYWPDEIEDNYQERTLNLEEAIAYFEQNHPQLKIYQEKINQLGLQKKIIQANNLPQIATVAEVHYGRPGLNFFKKEWSFYATAGLAIQFRFFDWFQGRNQIEQLNLDEQKIIKEKEDFLARGKLELKKLYEQKEILAGKLNHLENILRLAEEEVKIKEELARQNLLPHLDYLASLQAFEQNKWAREEILLMIEEIKVKINSVIALKGESR
ncbi:MAG: TolC family protein [Candidatus Aminicenantes bacterium]|nr:TolC family protein [Candidatus Aminicenantes bacterium]